MTRSSPQAAILAIGTELTTGQITNRNAAWISERLTDVGVQVVLHETVADDRSRIHNALSRIMEVVGPGGFLFVTGGLGPTTDDFTREVIAEWSHKTLVFEEASWKRIGERLGRFGIPVAESNRQQCYFPQGAEVLPNPRGTADAFTFQHESVQIWVLPGPPVEIAAVWENAAIEKTIRARVPELEPVYLYTWQCLGRSEAELGELTETALQGSGLRTGYRAHRPYIEIKVWCPQAQQAQAGPYLKKIEAAIAPWAVARKEGELVRRFLQAIRSFEEIEILDAASGGILTERLGPFLRTPEFSPLTPSIMIATEWFAPSSGETSPEVWLSQALQTSDELALTLAFCGFSAQGEWAVGLRKDETVRQMTFQVPFKRWEAPEILERTQRYAAEMAIYQWVQWLEESWQ